MLGFAQPTNEKRAKGNFCQGCKSIVSFARTLNSTDRRDEYKEVFKSFCELYYPNSTDFQKGPCTLIVAGFYHFLETIDPVQHCDQIGACGSQSRGTLDNLVLDNEVHGDLTPGASNVVCEVCEKAFESVQKSLEDPKVINDVQKKIEELCNYMSVVGQDKQCLQLMRNYLQQAIEFIRNAKANQYCRAIHMCYGPKPASVKLMPHSDLTFAQFKGFGLETEVVIGNKQQARPQQQEPLDCHSAPNCALCKTVVKELFHFIKNNRTEEKIEQALDGVCRLVYESNPDKLEQCESMVKAYSKEIVQMIIDETDPEVICMMLEQCTCRVAQPDREDFSSFLSKLDPTIPLNSARTCIECKFFIDYLKESIEKPQTQNFVRYWLLDNLCAKAEEADLKKTCEQMVTKYSQAFFDAIAQELDAGVVCRDLGACKHASKTLVFNAYGVEEPSLLVAGKVMSQRRPAPVVRASPFCDKCINIISQIDEYMSTHPIDQDVTAIIDNVCNKMNSETLKQECTMIVKTLGSEIVNAIASMDSPRQLCSKILLC